MAFEKIWIWTWNSERTCIVIISKYGRVKRTSLRIGGETAWTK